MDTHTTTTDTNNKDLIDLGYYRQCIMDDMIRDHARIVEANIFAMVVRKKYTHIVINEPQD